MSILVMRISSGCTQRSERNRWLHDEFSATIDDDYDVYGQSDEWSGRL